MQINRSQGVFITRAAALVASAGLILSLLSGVAQAAYDPTVNGPKECAADGLSIAEFDQQMRGGGLVDNDASTPSPAPAPQQEPIEDDDLANQTDPASVLEVLKKAGASFASVLMAPGGRKCPVPQAAIRLARSQPMVPYTGSEPNSFCCECSRTHLRKDDPRGASALMFPAGLLPVDCKMVGVLAFIATKHATLQTSMTIYRADFGSGDWNFGRLWDSETPVTLTNQDRSWNQVHWATSRKDGQNMAPGIYRIVIKATDPITGAIKTWGDPFAPGLTPNQQQAAWFETRCDIDP